MFPHTEKRKQEALLGEDFLLQNYVKDKMALNECLVIDFEDNASINKG